MAISQIVYTNNRSLITAQWMCLPQFSPQYHSLSLFVSDRLCVAFPYTILFSLCFKLHERNKRCCCCCCWQTHTIETSLSSMCIKTSDTFTRRPFYSSIYRKVMISLQWKNALPKLSEEKNGIQPKSDHYSERKIEKFTAAARLSATIKDRFSFHFFPSF